MIGSEKAAIGTVIWSAAGLTITTPDMLAEINTLVDTISKVVLIIGALVGLYFTIKDRVKKKKTNG